MKQYLPVWLQPSFDGLTVVALVVLVLLVAWLARAVVRGIARRMRARYQFSEQMIAVPLRVAGAAINLAALFAILQILGVSSTVLWTAFTGFAAVGAIAFFAGWSVLSNLFCTLLIVVMRPFRLHDRIELLEGGDKPGVKGEVVDINMVYTSLLEADGSTLQVPNVLFFQRITRRWPLPDDARARLTPGDGNG
ncbi:mechanosensitive ion channel family protein [Dokdonella sp.]|uniref:mechanosensitive ion channel domain-containing protein n=1 Tax=Dokdonella sp. TaxID=2291710 RepID=UPI0025B7FADB|nr:mechanosensitive ion channel family protein [Dokdonella sp.]MBX3688534.1 mechanosensitive ion channel family protein [Dokdonella sp.]